MAEGPWTLIANPAAGSRRRRRLVGVCVRQLEAAGGAVTLSWTRCRGHAFDLARDAVSAGGTVVVCGGDGTVAEVLPAMAGGSAALGLLPFGTCNDLARSLRIPLAPRRAVDTLLRGTARPVDLGRCGDRWFATVATFGFDAEVNQAVLEGGSLLPGTAGYLLTALRHLGRYRPPRVRVRGDFGEWEQEIFLAATANTRCYGGGMRIAPDADPTDGLLDLCLIDGAVPPLAVLSMMPRIFSGGHVGSRWVRLLRSSFVELEPLDGARVLHADGEPLTSAPARLHVEPQALRVIQPTVASAAASYPAASDRSP